MDTNRFNGIVKAVRAAYPQLKFIESKEGMQIWLKALEDTPDELVSLAFENHIMTAKYPPSIAEIRERIFSLSSNTTDDWTAAFDLVRRAIAKYGSYREEEALAWIGEQNTTAAEVARRLGFKDICLAENLDVIRGQFRMAYTNYMTNKKDYGMLPYATRARQEAIQGQYRQNEITGSRNINDLVQAISEDMGI